MLSSTATVPINVPTNEETIPPPEYIQFGNNEDQRPLIINTVGK